mgnify:FL=1
MGGTAMTRRRLTGNEPEWVTERGRATDSGCAWVAGEQRCQLPVEWSPCVPGGRGWCSWHAQFKGLSGAGSSRRAAEDFEEFCRWWEDWYGPKAQIPYCALWSHHVPGELWALMHGNPVKLSSPTACRVPSCPHRAWPPFTGTPKEAMREMRQLLDHVVEKIIAP